jgi:hypothetical protein
MQDAEIRMERIRQKRNSLTDIWLNERGIIKYAPRGIIVTNDVDLLIVAGERRV